MLILDVITTESRQRLEENALDRLLQGVAGGDRDALAELYGRARTAVYALALSYLKNPTEAEDVTQDTFVQIWEKAPAYRSEGKALAWIMTIARNLARMRLRRQQRAGDLTEEEWMALPDEGRGLSHEERMLLHSAVAALSEQERQIVLLYAVTGWKHREIAALLQMPLPTVLSKYHRALKKLKTHWKGEDAL